jgi:hypothetical protein
MAYDRSMQAYKSRYQDTVKDMKAAGLNPILAASGGFNVGNSVQAQPAQAFQAHNIQSPASSARDVSSIETNKTQAQLNTQKKAESVQNALKHAAQSGKFTEEANLLAAKVHQVTASVNLMQEQAEEAQASAYQKRQQGNFYSSQKKKIAAEVKTMGAKLAQLKTESNVYDHPYGQWIKWATEILKAVGLPLAILGAFGALSPAGKGLKVGSKLLKYYRKRPSTKKKVFNKARKEYIKSFDKQYPNYEMSKAKYDKQLREFKNRRR